MRKHWKYLTYIVRHKWFVCLAGRKIGASLWLLLIHDWSKLLPCEWFPYVRYFYGDGKELSEFNAAWLHHQHKNPHHWQHWVLREDSGATFPIPMPEKYVREMVADWMGAGRAITGKWGAAAWYRKNADKMQLHPDTRARVEILLFLYA